MSHTAELRRQIEELAMRLVVDDPAAAKDTPEAARWVADLERIQRTATAEHAGAVAAAAASMMDEVRSGGDAQQGILRLQQVLEEEAQSAAVAAMPPSQDPELLGDFVLESREHLAVIESQMLTIERNPSDSEALHSAFRAFHTIKGLAGFLELWDVQELSHEVEAVLDRARNAQLVLTSAAIDVVLLAADKLRHWMSHVERLLSGQASDPPPRDEALLHTIRGAGTGTSEPEDPSIPSEAVEDNNRPEVPSAGSTTQATAGGHTMAVKVDTAKLDSLVDMAGELVIAQSLVRHDPEIGALKSASLQRKVAQLTRITAELQKTAMAMRMVPVGPLFRRMARLVRDLSRQFGKRVEMEMVGEDIELDRTIVEELADPLMHMVRNALDHGIEPPAEREQREKAGMARVRLKAYHQGGNVVIEIEDDGRGLDRDRIVAKAIQRGIIASGEGMADSDVFNLIFEPGFSTAAQVTNVSGRGVGMDVVRRHIEKLRGRVEIRSAKDVGSTFLLKVPLTLAIIDGLVVGVGQERYIVPLFAIRELLRPGEETVWTVRQSAEMALVRGMLLPVVRLYRRFGLTPRSEDPRQSVLVVAEAEGQPFCLMVDEVIGKQEVVIKALGETFKNIPGIAGGAILGDGRVGLILEMEKLAKDRVCDAAR